MDWIYTILRDFKTANVFMAEGGLLKVGDFGVSKVLSSTLALAKTAIGTPYYISPEICLNRPYNAKADIWSLGCVLYEMLTLRHAFEAPSINKLAEKIIQGRQLQYYCRYAPVSGRYSRGTRDLLASLLSVPPRMRPSASAILQLPLIKQRLERLLTQDSGPSPLMRQVFASVSPSPKPLPNLVSAAPSPQAARGPAQEAAQAAQPLALRAASEPQHKSSAVQRRSLVQGKVPASASKQGAGDVGPLLRFRDIPPVQVAVQPRSAPARRHSCDSAWRPRSAPAMPPSGVSRKPLMGSEASPQDKQRRSSNAGRRRSSAHEPCMGVLAGAGHARRTSAQELPGPGRPPPAHNAKPVAAEPGPHKRVPGLIRQRSYSADGWAGYQPQHVQHLRPPSAPANSVQSHARKAAAVGVQPDAFVRIERQQEAEKSSGAAEALQHLSSPFSNGINFPEPPVAGGSEKATAVLGRPSGKPPLGKMPPSRARSTSLDSAAALLRFAGAGRSRPYQEDVAPPTQGRLSLAPSGQKRSPESVDAAAAAQLCGQRSHSVGSMHGAQSPVGATAASPRLPAAPGNRAGSEQPPRQAPARGTAPGQPASNSPAARLRTNGILRQRSISADGAVRAAEIYGAEEDSAPFRLHADAPRGATPAFTAMQRRQAYMEMQMAAKINRLRATGQDPSHVLPISQPGEKIRPQQQPSFLSAVEEEPDQLISAQLEDLHSYVSGAPSDYALDAVSESVFLMP
ncbi:probable serine/threonine-protein kinase Nek1 at N-terminal half [Coccomyxa sp. Obi]|nr:probable serine/threonine-protein kinase Nek1 at N-terminal half [Coccomyxa sp. Obi]